MEDMDELVQDFGIVSQSFQLVSALSMLKEVEERRIRIKEYLKTIEKQDLDDCPDFQHGLEWFNTSRPISMKKDLRGKLVVLDFFTYCCINCLHILPDLHRLEQTHPAKDGLVVIGVHSAKFDNEKVSSNILSAVLRYNITHPVVNDYDANMWNELSIQCWPTLVAVAPNGHILLHLVGEGHSKILEDFVDVALQYYNHRKNIDLHDKLPISLNRDVQSASPLSFPGKIAVDESGKRLAISDTGHHRVIITDLSGVALHTVGSGNAGMEDGDFDRASFNSPQGLAWKNNLIYVADTENHAIRQIDMDKLEVTRIAGTGRQGEDKEGGETGINQEISSPWDVTLAYSLDRCDKDVLFIAMAGTHQIWTLFLNDTTWLKKMKHKKGTCIRFAGNGAEENRNNNYPHAAAFAQPSGLCVYHEQNTHNSEAGSSSGVFMPSSKLHGALIQNDGHIKIPPPPPNLIGANQGHPPPPLGPPPPPPLTVGPPPPPSLGLPPPVLNVGPSMSKGSCSMLYVADSESSTIRSVSLSSGAVKNVVGGNRNPTDLFAFGDVDGVGIEARLQHPLSVCVSNDGQTLYIADSYNHKIKRVNLETKECKTMLCSAKTGIGSAETTLDEPGGMSLHPNGENLYIADTNNHAIKVYNFMDKSITELPILFPPIKIQLGKVLNDETDHHSKKPAYKRLAPKSATMVELPTLQVAGGTRVRLQLGMRLGENLHPTEGAPMAWQISAQDDVSELLLSEVPVSRGETEDYLKQPTFTLKVPSDPKDTKYMVISVEAVCYFCDDNGACRMKGVEFKQPFNISYLNDHLAQTQHIQEIALNYEINI